MKTMYAILSDIHGNFPALEAVVADAKQNAKDKDAVLKFMCLVDILDYGPQPNECVEWMRNEKHLVVLMGNHDEDVLDDIDAFFAIDNPDSWPPVVTVWTNCTLKNDNKEWLRKQKDDAYGLMHKVGVNGLANFTIFHSSLSKDQHQVYIRTPGEYDREREICSTKYALFGHTHNQMYFVPGRESENSIMFFAVTPDQQDQLLARSWNGVHGLTLIDEWLPLNDAMSGAFINPGSVGQPRKHGGILKATFTAHGAYLLILHQLNGPSRFMFRQVHYTVDDTIELIKEKMVWSTAKTRKSPGNPILPEGSSGKKWYTVSKRMAHYMKEQLPREHTRLINTLLYG